LTFPLLLNAMMWTMWLTPYCFRQGSISGTISKSVGFQTRTLGRCIVPMMVCSSLFTGRRGPNE
jgi:hypothetical protein